jgi:50S ribosomal protein L16 3-hydroxylase
MARQTTTVLGNLPIRRFLQDYWQKEPVVVRGAFPGFKDPLSPEELAGLSCEPHVDSRLVVQRGGSRPWQVSRGPQKASRLRRLPRSHWTLLVESVDRHSDAIASLASAFSFLPRWRMDDVMVSLAPNHGTVDAHIDSYDVFLIQGQGRRRWEVDRKAKPDYRPGLDLRILKRFQAEDSAVLEPGDMLYVPPGVGHRGVTVPSDSEIALTYSIGFRAPSTSDLLSTMLARTLAAETPVLFSDPGRSEAKSASELSSADLGALKRFMVGQLEATEPDSWVLAAGEAVTSGGGCGASVRVAAQTLTRKLQGGAAVAPDPAARLAWTALPGGRAALFVNGESRVLPRSQAFAAPLLCGDRLPSSAARRSWDDPLILLAVELFRAGVIRWRD